jgi:hypothetical protein
MTSPDVASRVASQSLTSLDSLSCPSHNLMTARRLLCLTRVEVIDLTLKTKNPMRIQTRGMKRLGRTWIRQCVQCLPPNASLQRHTANEGASIRLLPVWRGGDLVLQVARNSRLVALETAGILVR